MRARFFQHILATLTVLAPFAAQAIMPPERAGLPNLDKRTATAPAPNQQQAIEQLKVFLPSAQVDQDEILGTPKFVRATDGFLTGQGGEGLAVKPATLQALPPNDPHRVAKAFLNEHAALFGHGAEVLATARTKRDYVTPHNGLRTVVWQQELDGIGLFEGLLTAHTTQRGELANMSSRFLADPAKAADNGSANRKALQQTPTVSAEQAVAAAARNIGETLTEQEVIRTGPAPEGAEKRQRLTAPGLLGEADAKLVWLPMNRDTMRLCWEVILTGRTRGEMFQIVIDAQTAEVLVRRCLTEYISDATYNVFTSDSPSPFSPSLSTPSSYQPPVVARQLVALSAMSIIGSPNGWINDGDNTTLGNNVDAHLDRDADDVPDPGSRPTGSPFRVFDFPMNLAQAPVTYTNASVVQLFYLNNVMHDRLYDLGFTEAAGNFQTDNFGRGGAGNDAVQADAQDGSGVNNANFSTPPDGLPGRMQMYIFTGPNPDRDGDFDAEIVMHEYTHGLSNRLVGGGVGMSALQSRGMGEGWSDFYPLCLLSESSDDPNACYACGGYATYLFAGLTENYYYGIRRYPYSTDMTKNPLTFKDIDPARADPHAGVPRSPIIPNTANEVHNMGEVWCVTLWEARATLINRYGWTAGNQLILQLVTDGMRLSPANPTYLQARDAILLADQINTGGSNRNELWGAFAKRGMGFSASAPPSSTTSGVVEAYDVPPPGAGFLLPWGNSSYGQSNVPGGLVNVIGLAAGSGHNLALGANGRVVAWGSNVQLETNVPTSLTGVVSVVAGDWHTVALKNDKTVAVWGNNRFGQLNVPVGVNNIIAIAAGDWHNLALRSNGTVVAWGDNRYGQLNVPANLNGVVSIAAGYYHNLALKDDGTVVGWGNNTSGQLSPPAGLCGVVAVAAGCWHSLALKSNGTVVAWGNNHYGQISVPTGLSNVIGIAAGYSHSIALGGDGKVVTWGNDRPPAYLTNVVAIAAGDFHSVALRPFGPTNRNNNLLLPSGTVGTFYSTFLQGSGGVPPYSWTLVSGKLPDGLNLSGIGTISGTPTKAGMACFRVRVTGGNGSATEKDHCIIINGGGIALPADSSVIGSSSATFTWDATFGATQYALWLGNSASSYDLYAGSSLGRWLTLASLPTDGRTLFASLWALINGTWVLEDTTTYTAPTATPATMLRPVDGATLTGASATFIWDTGVGVSQYALWVGNAPQTYDIYAGFQSSQSRKLTLPTDGRPLYVTLWSKTNGAWGPRSYTYTAYSTPAPVLAQMLSPANGATLTGGSATFIWDTGVGVGWYALWVGNAPGWYDIYAGYESGRSRKLTLPTDGRPIFVRLWSWINGAWQWNSYSYICGGGPAPAPTPAAMLVPAGGSTLTSATTTFIWNAGSGVTRYALWVGNSPASYDIYAGFENGNARTLTLPADGRTIHVTLWSLVNGAWQSNAYVYTAYTQPTANAAMLLPTSGTTLTGSSATFIWDTGIGVSAYALWVGNAPNSYDIYQGLESGQSRTLTLPMDGRTLYVTLWSWVNNAWRSNAYTYTAFPIQ